MTFDLGLSPDQRALEDAFRAFFEAESPPGVARAAEPLGFDASLWQRLRELGAPGMGVADDAGGGGATLLDLAIVAELVGRAIAPVPFVEHAVASRLHPLADIVDGSAVATISLRPADATGTWRLVPAGAVAHVVIGVDGGDVVAVRSAPPGAIPRNHAAAPLADRSARDADRTVLGRAAAFGTALAEWKTLTAAALVGIAARSLELGVAYAKERKQFGALIGTFQAVQHGLASLPAIVDGARLLAYKAAWAAQHDGVRELDAGNNRVSDPQALAAMSFVFAADAAAQATDRSLHFHGGYGFAEEYDIQLYYRRARGWALVYDDPSRECVRLGASLWPRQAVS